MEGRLEMYNFQKIAIMMVLVLAGCGSSDSPVDMEADCSQRGQNKTLYGVMHDAYLWYENVPELDYASYHDLRPLLEDLKYTNLDKWSYVIPKEVYDNYYSGGAYVGYGFSMKRYQGDRIFLGVVYQGSPSDRAGLSRGAEVLEINGKTIAEIDSEDLWGTIFGENRLGVSGRFKISQDGIVHTITMEKEAIETKSILADSILTVSGKKVGYFVFNKFIEPSKDELKKQFRKFKEAGVEALILDMRYNGGGRVHVAQYLASLIAGDRANGQVVASLQYNDRYRAWDEPYPFTIEEERLNLSEVYILTTGSTCSASELVVNGLKPFVSVKMIGSKTCGKPVGMRGYSFCGNHLAPIQFGVVNARGEGDYFDGIGVDCVADDDVTHRFGEREESMLKEAIYLIGTGECSASGTAKWRKRVSQKVSKQPLMRGWQREIGAF